MTDEFVHAYSDDQIFLHMLNELVEHHPTESTTPESIVISSCCRLSAVLTIGGLDTMVINFSKKIAGCEELADFAEAGENRAKVQRLKRFIRQSGINIDDEVFEDYLAIKYIRNAYIHSRWSEKHKEFVNKRGFPDNVMQFTVEHFKRIKKTHLEVMNAIGMAGVARDMSNTRKGTGS